MGIKWFFCLVALAAQAETVWLDMDQQALDDAYDQSVYAANLEQVIERYVANSNTVREVLGDPLRFRYAEGVDAELDVYKTDASNAPIHIFVHGGAWKLGDAQINAFAAEMFVDNGVHFVVPDFAPVQTHDGDLLPMVEQLRTAMAWIYANAESTFGGDPQQIYVSGFSSGGHLASVLLTTDWQSWDETLPKDLIKGAVLCSGMYDLYPVSLSARRHYVDFTEERIAALSAVHHIYQVQCPVVIAYGTEETPEFKRQAKEFAAMLLKADVDVQLIVGEQYNHFEIIETLANPYGLLGRAALEQIFPER
jgi:arylformamidase